VGLITDAIHESYLWSTGDTAAFTFVRQTGTYFVTVTEGGCSGISQPVSLFALEMPTPEVVQIAPDSLQSDLMASSYTWYFNATLLPDETRAIHATQSGTYQVQLANEIGCVSDKSAFFSFTTTGLETLAGLLRWRIFPNPGTGLFTLDYEAEQAEILELTIHDGTGRMLWRQTLRSTAGSGRLFIDLQGYASGVYYVRVRTRLGEGGMRLVKS
jgi:hypothetical protein